MSIESEVCAFIRGRKDKAFALELAPTIFCISYTRIFEILQKAGLMDRNYNYIEPLRLTGKEQTMAKNYPSYRWSPERKQKLAELYQAGSSPSDIAGQLGTTTDIVYEGISKFNITRTKKVEQIVAVTSPPITPPEPPAAPSEERVLPMLSLDELSEIRRYITYTQELVRDASKMFLDDRCYEAFQALGKQEILLQNVQQILRKVFPVTQTREP